MNTIGLNQGDWDKHFKLTADIDMSAYTGDTYNLIGYWDEAASEWVGFSGVFDGNGHTISNFTYHTDVEEPLIRGVALISVISDASAEVKNLGFITPDINAPLVDMVGAVAGRLVGGTIYNCYVEGGTVSGKGYVAGVVGRCLENSSVLDCHTSCTVTGVDGGAGGLVGSARGYLGNGAAPIISGCYSSSNVSGLTAAGLVAYNSGVIANCYATGTISATGGGGGLVGSHHGNDDEYADSIIINCYATGNVSGHQNVGGLVGANRGRIVDSYATGNVSWGSKLGGLVGLNESSEWGVGSTAIISRCYATGSVSGSQWIGGLVGFNDGGEISNSYARGSASGHNRAAGLVGTNDNGGSISKCYSTGPISGSYGLGGLVAENINGSTVSSSFWDVQTSGMSTSVGGTGKTTAQMKTRSTFTSAGWDFEGESANGTEDIWRLCVDLTDYPRFVWQKRLLADFVCPDGSDALDLVFFLDRWLADDCDELNDYCDGTDLNRSSEVDGKDYGLFAENWSDDLTE
jgi:hypothetical protein